MRRPAAWAFITATGLLAPLAIACGGGSNLPEAPPCVAPTPFAMSAGGTNPEFRYAIAVRDGVSQLESLTASFRLNWPDRRFSSRAEFRTEFVAYAGESTCIANDLLALTPAGTSRFSDFEARFEPLMQNYLDVMAEGTKAVRTRNVSDYRQFHRRLDDVHAELADAVFSLRTRR